MIEEEVSHMKVFASQLETAIDSYGFTDDWYKRQKKQLQDLIALENEFKKKLTGHPVYGRFSYKRFITYICDEQRNILDARPYFRERAKMFASSISKELKVRNYKGLYQFGINYKFIAFIMGQRKWAPKGVFSKLFKQIGELRKEIVTMNTPLIINRARLFYSRTPKSHLSQMDLIGIGIEGLISGVDKYTPDKSGVIITKQFRSTAVGRAGGNYIEASSETLIHFFPVDKRKIYRANKLLGKSVGIVDYEKLATGVNDNAALFVKDNATTTSHITTSDEIADLVAAASTVSSDTSLPTDVDAPAPIERFAAPETSQPDIQVEQMDALKHMGEAMLDLTVFEKKLLRLRGIRLT